MGVKKRVERENLVYFLKTKQSDKHASKPNTLVQNLRRVNLNYHVKCHQDLEIHIKHTYNHTINKLIFQYKACRIAKYGTLATLLER